MAGKNSIYFFQDGKPINTGSDYVTAIKKGYEAGAFFLMPTAGVINTEQKLAEYQKLESTARMGDLMYVDTNKDGILNDDDRVYAGSGMPEFELGLNFAADYKGFDFSMNWYSSIGNEIINGTKIYTYQKKRTKNLYICGRRPITLLLFHHIEMSNITITELILICGLRMGLLYV